MWEGERYEAVEDEEDVSRQVSKVVSWKSWK